MTTEFHNLNALWAHLIVEELIRHGIRSFFLSPGSRNAPLVTAIAENTRAESVVHYDERGSAFHAVGYARATMTPAVVVSTSGTAAANFYPAVVEASMDMVPLIVLTADRPPELRDTGANQTIDQVKMYGDSVRWFFDMPCPDEAIAPRFVLSTIDEAIRQALSSPAGPVHLNTMFREPLTPVGTKKDFSAYLTPIARWRERRKPYTDFHVGVPSASDEAVATVAETLSKARRGLVIVGRLAREEERQAVWEVCRHLKIPVFPDIASGMRLGKRADNVIAFYDVMLQSERFFNELRPDVILHFGRVPTSKRLQQLCAAYPPKEYIHIASHSLRDDPDHLVTNRVEVDIPTFCKRLVTSLPPADPPSSWLEQFKTASKKAETVLAKELDTGDALSEPAIARLISRYILSDSGLFLASSMPIRDMDMFADPSGAPVVVGCNRGASGIDGTIATAAGFARGLQKPVTLLMGDLAFLHDVNSLALAASLPHPLIMVVINNNGGGIFSFLPISQWKDKFEPYFAAPHGLTFSHAAEMFGIAYASPSDRASFVQAYQKAQEEKHSIIIEVSTDRNDNVALHRLIAEKIVAALETFPQ